MSEKKEWIENLPPGKSFQQWLPPTKEQYENALLSIKLNKNQIAILKELYNTPAGKITSTELAIAAGYKPQPGGANLSLVNIGKKILKFLASYPPPLHGTGKIFWAGAASGGYWEDAYTWYWQIYPEMAEALESLGWV